LLSGRRTAKRDYPLRRTDLIAGENTVFVVFGVLTVDPSRKYYRSRKFASANGAAATTDARKPHLVKHR
jgi:hypothetical protein